MATFLLPGQFDFAKPSGRRRREVVEVAVGWRMLLPSVDEKNERRNCGRGQATTLAEAIEFSERNVLDIVRSKETQGYMIRQSFFSPLFCSSSKMAFSSSVRSPFLALASIAFLLLSLSALARLINTVVG